MSDQTRTASIYNIPAGMAFADTLAGLILDETVNNPETLTQYRILLPTRRGCRHMRDAFLRLTGGRPILLPRLQTIGDIDEDELMFGIAGCETADMMLDIPPALDPLARQIIMAKLIGANEKFVHTPDHALKLAKALGQLLDQIYNENLDMADLVNIVPEDFADHWQITLEFLQIISLHWPRILEERGVIDAADRRNRLINALAEYWEQNPPETPVIAAGSTGSMPAPARLLKTVSMMPKGRLILPGLDDDIDDDSWDTLDDTHPQATLQKLLDVIGIERKDVQPLRPDIKISNPRHALAREIMRPADTAAEWQNMASQKDTIRQALEQLSLYECRTQEEEAHVIAILMREILEDPEKTAALVTPDRVLAQRVTAACKRWGIQVDDSAGAALPDTDIGSFMAISANLLLQDFSPISLLSFLRHPFVKLDMANVQRTSLINLMEIELLRGPAPRKGFEGLRRLLIEKTEEGYIKQSEKIAAFLDLLEPFFAPMISYQKGTHPFSDILRAQIAMLESISDRESMSGTDLLWADDAGNAAVALFSQLLEQGHIADCTLSEYSAILDHFMRGITVRSPYGVHPRLYILGQLEARMIRADRVILASLNEGTWPPNPSVDPWMSRPMRGEFGLPSYERSVGLSAHDFVLGLCAGDVILTRAQRVDSAPTIPARWIQRMDTVLHAAGIEPKTIRHSRITAYLAEMTQCTQSEFLTRPAPRPPVEKRPKTLSVTSIEKWMRDPYSIYARYILRLKKLDALEDKADAALRGTIIHKALEIFMERHPVAMPPDALEILTNIGDELMRDHIRDEQLYAFWKPRFENLAAWFIDHETKWRSAATHITNEAQGEITLPNGFTLRAKADRIDRFKDGDGAIIDYKTGTVPNNKDVITGFSPQMPLEGLIMAHGGFEECKDVHPQYIGFWNLTGSGKKHGDERPVKIKEFDDFESFIAMTERGFTGLVDIFSQPDIPYYSLPRPAKAPPAAWQDYAHLARVQEWAAMDDSTEDAA